MAVAGKILSTSFDQKRAVGKLEFTPLLLSGDRVADSYYPDPTVIFVPERWYYAETGYEVKIEPAGAAKWNATTNYVTVYHAAQNGAENISVTIAPKVPRGRSPQGVEEESLEDELAGNLSDEGFFALSLEEGSLEDELAGNLSRGISRFGYAA